ncbi:MAG TPA: Gfo/Idh/MocA family oxidoreductase [Acidimicrobiales bacterium]|nr:Gfo/Idh/MocA family oxidoreductase [Acidimicrobiales bacterium]
MTVLDVGLVGAGPWARFVHGPTLAAGPETHLVGVWARRPNAAAELAGTLGTRAFDRYEDMLDACSAVAFAVPPAVQAELAVTAAQAGKALLLEKPIAADLAGAERLADATAAAGVVSVVVLTWRYAEVVRSFLRDVAALEPTGGFAHFVSGALLGGPFATPWRLERGALLDLGPHVIDLLDAALGPVVDVRAHGASLGWCGLLLEHAGGHVSEASLCATAKVEPHLAGASVFGVRGAARVDCTTAVGADAIATLRREFAEAASTGAPHPLDVHHGLHLQRLIIAAEDQLNSRA